MGPAAVIPTAYSHLQFLVRRQLAVFPDHAAFLQRRFSNITEDSLGFAETIATKLVQIAGSQVDSLCNDYRWLSAAVLEEELHFRRSGRYRLSTFAEARKEVYSDPQYMVRYMNGLLLSQLWWRNHTETLRFFREDFVDRNPTNAAHLEIGPGHGLLLYLAVQSRSRAIAEAWDVSESSLEQTRNALNAMQIRRGVSLKQIDLFDAPKAKFGSIVISEVLEHLERPRQALNVLRQLLAQGGRMFINVPINSPAPDHIYLFRTPEELLDMIVNAGFAIERSQFSPATGATLERARKFKLTISVSAIVREG
jgi:2-polyprenyl-3-methyl-5-hydroxy-6-metoxy-1,4-benzoquinol methylase